MDIPSGGSGDWDPSKQVGKGRAQEEKLMSPMAKDVPDAINGDNPMVQFEGKSGKVSGPYGQKEKNF